ncbi:hypothetical protein AN4320.2 [Aspergillus nidulans FGSC A4]|nr:hypothetical protein AN4320.2 [Aspergillus nidulans FGSC A4]|eukprot:XP_661924.1 hypothetical protein AN4320.2 [Aspergillus nidulans FGSC A4]
MSPSRGYITTYPPRVRQYANALFTPVIPQTQVGPTPRTTKRGTAAINYAEDGFDDDDFDDSEGPRRPTGLRSLRREESSFDKAALAEKLGKEAHAPVEVQGIFRDWMIKKMIRPAYPGMLLTQRLTRRCLRTGDLIPYLRFGSRTRLCGIFMKRFLPLKSLLLDLSMTWTFPTSMHDPGDRYPDPPAIRGICGRRATSVVSKYTTKISRSTSRFIARRIQYSRASPYCDTGQPRHTGDSDERAPCKRQTSYIRTSSSGPSYILLGWPRNSQRLLLKLKKEVCESGGLISGLGSYGTEIDNQAANGAEAGWRYDPEGLGDEWEPKVETLSKEEIEKREGDRERQIRRLRRETARFSSTAGITPDFARHGGGFFDVDSETPLGRGERNKRKRRFRSLSPSGRGGTPGGRGTPDTGSGAGYGGGGGNDKIGGAATAWYGDQRYGLYATAQLAQEYANPPMVHLYNC